MRGRHQAGPALLVVLALAFTFLGGCFDREESTFPDVRPADGTWSRAGTPAPAFRQTLGDPARSGAEEWPAPFDNTPATFDLDADGVKEVIAQSYDRNVYVFNPKTGRTVATLPTTYPPSWHIERILNGVTAGVLVPGQPASIVVANAAAYVAAWTLEPKESTPDRLVFRKAWERHMDACHQNPGMDAAPTLADLDGDGSLEVLIQTEEVGLYALTARGTTLWHQCWGGGNSAPTAADLDRDGKVEAIFASDAGVIAVLRGDNGRPLWTFDARTLGLSPASVPVTPTVADLDGQGQLEILFTARVAPRTEPNFRANHLAIVAIHKDPLASRGILLWMTQPEWGNPLSNTRLLVRDVDGDGSPDIFGMDWNTIGHSPGNWERLGAANVFRLDARGSVVWVNKIDAWWSNQDIAISDSDGDGRIDLLVNGPADGGDGLWRLSPIDGKPQGFIALAPWKMLRGPVVVDLYRQGPPQMLFPVTPVEGSEHVGAILVFDLPKGAKSAA